MFVFRDSWDDRDHWFNEIAPDLHRLTDVRAMEITLRVAKFVDADSLYRTGFFAAFPHVTRLVLSGHFDEQLGPAPLIEMMCLFPALQELDTRAMAGSLANPPATAVPPPALHILKLSVTPAGPILAWLHAFNHLSNVDSLALPLLKQEHIPTVCTALRRLGDTLQHLSITLTWLLMTADLGSIVFNLSLHPNLKSLVITDSSWPRPGDFDPNRMIQLITRLAAPALEHLTLDLLNLSFYRNSDWASLDAFLASARFQCLRKVALRSRNDGDSQFFRGALPLTRGFGRTRSGVLGVIHEMRSVPCTIQFLLAGER
ncbi:hypothetical protein MVEN_01358400 [Mycena venus]|uniref:Uncharacterized protein n=1 Tax=Mycena venus TaxID=2733690 RepID=A0A8H6XZL0_9AGAR|nr:hypothetical protein MVEN_01358400 [Mycena venus]